MPAKKGRKSAASKTTSIPTPPSTPNGKDGDETWEPPSTSRSRSTTKASSRGKSKGTPIRGPVVSARISARARAEERQLEEALKASISPDSNSTQGTTALPQADSDPHTFRESVDPPAVEKTPVSSPKGKTVLTSTSILATSGGALSTESPFFKNFRGFHSQEKDLKEKEIPQMETMGDDNLPRTAESEPTGNEDRGELPTKLEHTDNISSEVGEMACTESNALENKPSLASESEVAPQEFPPILIMPSVETTGHLQVAEAGDVEQPSIPGKYVLIRPTVPSEVGSNLISSVATDPPVSKREGGSVPGEVEKSWYTRTVETNTIPKEGPSSPVSRSLASQTLNFPPMDSSEDDPMQAPTYFPPSPAELEEVGHLKSQQKLEDINDNKHSGEVGLIKRFEEMKDNQKGCVDSPGIQPPMIGGKLLDSATVQRLNFTPAKESVPIEHEVCREQPSHPSINTPADEEFSPDIEFEDDEMGRLGESYFKEEREKSPGFGEIEEDEMDRDNSDLFGEEEEQDDMAEASEGKRLGAREVSGDRMLSDEIEKDVFLENIYGEDESSGFNRDEFNEWIDNNPGIKREINEEEELEEEDGDERRWEKNGLTKSGYDEDDFFDNEEDDDDDDDVNGISISSEATTLTDEASHETTESDESYETHTEDARSTWKVQRPVDPTFGWVGELAKEGERKVVHRETKKTLTHMATTHRFVPTQVYRCEICDVLIKGWDFTMGDHLHKMHFKGCDISAEDQDYFFSNIQGMIVRKSKFKS